MQLDLLDQVMSTFAPTSTGSAFDDYMDLITAMEEGAGKEIGVYINVAAAATSGGSATVTFEAIGNNSDPTFASGNKVLFTSGAIAVASLVAGYQIRGVIKRQDMVSLEPKTSFYRYMTIRTTIAVAALTAGTFNGWFTNNGVQDNLSYRAGYTV